MFRTLYGERVKNVVVDCSKDQILTEQSHSEDCDINNILKRFIRTGVIEHINEHKPQYGDVSSFDYHEAMNTLAKANSMFEELPSKVRAKFGNDPAAFLDYVQNPNVDLNELIDLGLVNKPAETLEATPLASAAASVEPANP